LLSYYKKTTIYTEDTVDIRRHKETRNSYKYDLLAPTCTWHIRDENTISVLSSISNNLWLKTIYIYIYIYIYTYFNFNTVQPKWYVSLLISITFQLFTQLLLYHRRYNHCYCFNRRLTLEYLLWDPNRYWI
jgi:hypothetical protein